MSKMKPIVSVLFWATLLFLLILSISSGAYAGQKATYKWLDKQMDRFHKIFDVYTDVSAAGNHFICYGQMGDGVDMDSCWNEGVRKGFTCIRCAFQNTGSNWGGFYFLNGVLQGEDRQPKPNWGEYPDAGFDLTGATNLTFWAKGQSGCEEIEFFAFGVGHPDQPHPDSSPKHSLGWVPLSSEWQQFTLSLAGLNLSYVIGGFGWIASSEHSTGPEVVFYLDDIKYRLSKQAREQRLNQPRFIQSYMTDGYATDFDQIVSNAAFVYDNALALIAYLARGGSDDLIRAELLADAIVYAQNHDRWYEDGRLRNAYQAGDLKLFPGWEPHGRSETARVPGRWECEERHWHEDLAQVSTSTGNVAWAIIALLHAAEAIADKAGDYRDAAETLGEWIYLHCYDESGYGGYTGGYEGWELSWAGHEGPIKLAWKSTEHNLDCYVAFTLLSQTFPEEAEKWEDRAEHARSFVETMWSDSEKRFFIGTEPEGGGDIINETPYVVDAQAWGVLALGEVRFHPSLKWARQNLRLRHRGFKGFDFGYDSAAELGPDGIWFEGTAHMSLAYASAGKLKKSERVLKQLRKARKTHPKGDRRWACGCVS